METGSSTTTWLRPPSLAMYMAVSAREKNSSTDSPRMYCVTPMDTETRLLRAPVQACDSTCARMRSQVLSAGSSEVPGKISRNSSPP
ncbi:hypothetical protein D3C71_2120460 [compost metagenome]